MDFSAIGALMTENGIVPFCVAAMFYLVQSSRKSHAQEREQIFNSFLTEIKEERTVFRDLVREIRTDFLDQIKDMKRGKSK